MKKLILYWLKSSAMRPVLAHMLAIFYQSILQYLQERHKAELNAGRVVVIGNNPNFLRDCTHPQCEKELVERFMKTEHITSKTGK
jgi:hypothetical protein